MSREALICAVLVALTAVLLTVRESRGQTIADLMDAAASMECPEQRTCSQPKALQTTLELPQSALPGDRWEVTAGSGWSPSTQEACIWATARAIRRRTLREDKISPTGILKIPDDCIPVPEPPVWMGVLVGLATIGGLTWLRSR